MLRRLRPLRAGNPTCEVENPALVDGTLYLGGRWPVLAYFLSVTTTGAETADTGSNPSAWAVTSTVSSCPTSAFLALYVRPSAAHCGSSSRTIGSPSRSHRYVKVTPSTDHSPGSAVSTPPLTALPVMLGGVKLTMPSGAAGPTSCPTPQRAVDW